MSLDYVKFSNGFEKFMPKEYRDMVEHGPFGKKVSVSQMGSFKEVLEEHPMCAGCAMTLFIRLAMIAFPNPEDTITVGTAGCGRLAISQAAIPFVYGNYGDQNGVASGLSRGLRLRFGDKPKDVVVMAGDGGTADVTASRLSKRFQLEHDGAAFNIQGWISYRKQDAFTVTLTIEASGENIFDESITITIPAATGGSYYGSGSYYGGSDYYGISFSQRVARQKFAVPGKPQEFQVRVAATEDVFWRIEEIGLRFDTAS